MKTIAIFSTLCVLLLVKTEDHCEEQEFCHECIQVPNCSWYLGEAPDSTRCFRNDPNITRRYKEEDVYNPQSSVFYVKHKLQRRKLQLRKDTPIVLDVVLMVKNDTIVIPDIKNIDIRFDRKTETKGTLEIKAKKCPKNDFKLNQEIHFFTTKSSQNLTLDIDLLCTCPCEEKQDSSRDIKCNNRGTLKCGICECENESYGKYCECDGPETNNCFHNEIECSGRGTCVCGTCICDIMENPEQIISGSRCQCDNFSCKYFDGKLCGGPERGTCVCGHCSCRRGWKGKNCGKLAKH